MLWYYDTVISHYCSSFFTICTRTTITFYPYFRSWSSHLYSLSQSPFLHTSFQHLYTNPQPHPLLFVITHLPIPYITLPHFFLCLFSLLYTSCLPALWASTDKSTLIGKVCLWHKFLGVQPHPHPTQPLFTRWTGRARYIFIHMEAKSTYTVWRSTSIEFRWERKRHLYMLHGRAATLHFAAAYGQNFFSCSL